MTNLVISPAEVLRAYFIDQNHLNGKDDPNDPSFLGTLKPEPTHQTVVSDSKVGVQKIARLMNGQTIRRYPVQVLVRHSSQITAMNKLLVLCEVVDGIQREEIEHKSDFYTLHNASIQSGPTPMGAEKDTDLEIWVLNVSLCCTKNPS